MKAVKTTLKLSKSRQKLLSQLKSADERKNLRAIWAQDAVKQAAKNNAFLEDVRSRELEFGLTPRGGVFVKNTGTRHSFLVMTPERAKVLLAKIAEFTAVLEQAGDREPVDGDQE